MKICKNCGFQIEDNSSFCGKCGQPYVDDNVTVTPTESVTEVVVDTAVNQPTPEVQPINTASVVNQQMPQFQPMNTQNTVPPVNNQNNKKGTVALIIIISVLAVVIIGLVILLVFKPFNNDDDTTNKDTGNSDVVEVDDDDDDINVTDNTNTTTNTDNNNNNTNNNDNNTVAQNNEYTYGNYKYVIPDGFKASVEDSALVLTNPTDKIQYYVYQHLYTTYEDCVAHKEDIKQAYQQDGVTISEDLKEETYLGKKMLTFKVNYNNANFGVLYVQVGTYDSIEVLYYNGGTKTDEEIKTQLAKFASYATSSNSSFSGKKDKKFSTKSAKEIKKIKKVS